MDRYTKVHFVEEKHRNKSRMILVLAVILIIAAIWVFATRRMYDESCANGVFENSSNVTFHYTVSVIGTVLFIGVVAAVFNGVVAAIGSAAVSV